MITDTITTTTTTTTTNYDYYLSIITVTIEAPRRRGVQPDGLRGARHGPLVLLR